MFRQPRFWILVALAFGAAALRLLPHPENFVPIGALALFSGSKFEEGRWRFGVPLLALFVSDLFIAFHVLSPWVYLGFVLMVGIGRRIGSEPGATAIAGGALAGSVAFYLLTNFGVWLLLGSFPPTLEGLLQCYVAGLGHLLRTIMGTLFYSAILFGGLSALEWRFPVLERGGAA